MSNNAKIINIDFTLFNTLSYPLTLFITGFPHWSVPCLARKLQRWREATSHNRMPIRLHGRCHRLLPTHQRRFQQWSPLLHAKSLHWVRITIPWIGCTLLCGDGRYFRMLLPDRPLDLATTSPKSFEGHRQRLCPNVSWWRSPLEHRSCNSTTVLQTKLLCGVSPQLSWDILKCFHPIALPVATSM